MRDFNRVRADAAIKGALASGKPDSPVLQQQTCLRCANKWWPRRPKKPLRCPGCKSPYWDRPRKLKLAPTPVVEPLNRAALQDSLRKDLAKALGTSQPESGSLADRSLVKALDVLKEMKAAGRTWQEMAERVEREFGTRLDKDQLKALVR
jgi:hypothetical protein